MNTLPHFKDLKNSLPNPDLCKLVENGGKWGPYAFKYWRERSEHQDEI